MRYRYNRDECTRVSTIELSLLLFPSEFTRMQLWSILVNAQNSVESYQRGLLRKGSTVHFPHNGGPGNVFHQSDCFLGIVAHATYSNRGNTTANFTAAQRVYPDVAGCSSLTHGRCSHEMINPVVMCYNCVRYQCSRGRGAPCDARMFWDFPVISCESLLLVRRLGDGRFDPILGSSSVIIRSTEGGDKTPTVRS